MLPGDLFVDEPFFQGLGPPSWKTKLDALLADIAAGSPYDCCSVRLDAAAALLGEVTGLDSPEEVLNRVFSSFCIGK